MPLLDYNVLFSQQTWRIGVQFTGEAMGTHNLCGLPSSHKTTKYQSLYDVFVYLMSPRKSNYTSWQVSSVNININSEFIFSFLVITVLFCH